MTTSEKLLTLRSEKGSPLTHEEMDNNFMFLNEQIKVDPVLRAEGRYRGVSPEEPVSISVDGTLRSVFGTDDHNVILNIRYIYRVRGSIVEKKGTVLLNFRNDEGTRLYITSIGDITPDTISNNMVSPDNLPDTVSGTVDISFPKIDGGAIIYWEASMTIDECIAFSGDFGVILNSKVS